MRASTIALVALAGVLLVSVPIALQPPRGIRNNNPGNIRESEGDNTLWRGERPTDDDADFEEFESPEYGIRAIVRVLRSYQRAGYLTLAEIIGRWAPPSENQTGAYIASVSKVTGIQPAQVVRDPEDFPALVAAIIKHENGMQPYTVAQIEQGVALA